MRYLFRHVLLRDTVYDMQLRARLRELHRQAAAAIAALHADHLAPHYADLAHHYRLAGETAQAVRYIRLASEQALAVSSYRTAQALLEQGLVLLLEQPLPDLEGPQMSLHNLLGDVYVGLCKYPLAVTHYEASLTLARQIGDKTGIADALLGLATSALGCGDYAAAHQHLEEALPWSERDSRLQTRVLHALGDVAREVGDYAASVAYAQQSLAICQNLDDQKQWAASLARLGHAAYVQGDVATAEAYYRQGLEIWRRIGQRMGIARCLNNLGAAAHRRGDYGEAMAAYRQSLEIEQEAGDRRMVAISWLNIALVAQQLGDYGAAAGYAHQSLETFREIGSRWGIALALGDLVPIYLQQGQPERARQSLREGLTIAQEIQAVPRALSLLLGAAQWAMQAGRFRQAAMWAGLVFFHPATEQDYRDGAEHLRQELAAALPPEELAAAWEQGAALDLDIVMAEVLTEVGECATCSSTS